jgi:hypothetical protein
VPSDTPTERAAAMQAALDDCNRVGLARACWLTEWGFSNNATQCPIDDRRRAALIHEVRQTLSQAARAGQLEAAFYFEWSGTTPRSVWRCGELTEAGRAALQPE